MYPDGMYVNAAKYQLGRMYLKKRNYTQGVELLQNVFNYARASGIRADESVHQTDIIRDLEEAEQYGAAIELLERIINTSDNETVRLKARIEIARNCFYNNDFVRAESICRELLGRSDIDSKTALDAKMIILSIERSRSND